MNHQNKEPGAHPGPHKRMIALAFAVAAVVLTAPMANADIDLREEKEMTDIVIPAGTMFLTEGEFHMEGLPAMVSVVDSRVVDSITYEMDWVIDSSMATIASDTTWTMTLTAVNVEEGVHVTIGETTAQEKVSWIAPATGMYETGALAATLDVPSGTDLVVASMVGDNAEGATTNSLAVGSTTTLQKVASKASLWHNPGVIRTAVDGFAVTCDVVPSLEMETIRTPKINTLQWSSGSSNYFQVAVADSNQDCDNGGGGSGGCGSGGIVSGGECGGGDTPPDCDSWSSPSTADNGVGGCLTTMATASISYPCTPSSVADCFDGGGSASAHSVIAGANVDVAGDANGIPFGDTCFYDGITSNACTASDKVFVAPWSGSGVTCVRATGLAKFHFGAPVTTNDHAIC